MTNAVDRLLLGGVPVHVAHRTSALRDRLHHLYAHALAAPLPSATAPLHAAPREHEGRTLQLFIEATPDRDAPPPPSTPTLRLVADRLIWGVLAGDVFELSDGRSHALVEYAAGRATLTLHRGAVASGGGGTSGEWDEPARYVATHRLFPLVLGELLRTKQRFLLHAAAVAGRTHGVLLVGESEAGKSTLTYRALRCGYRCVADDGVLIGPDANGELSAYPLYREFSLDPAVVEPADLADAKSIEPTAKGPRARLVLDEAHVAPSCRVTDVLLIERSASSRSSRSSCAKGLVLAELVRQNQFALLSPALAGAHLATLAHLTRRAASGRLTVARDVLEFDTVVEELLASRCTN